MSIYLLEMSVPVVAHLFDHGPYVKGYRIGSLTFEAPNIEAAKAEVPNKLSKYDVALDGKLHPAKAVRLVERTDLVIEEY